MDSYDEDRACNCGKCRYCKAMDSSEYDYDTAEFTCIRCNGAGCFKCEED